MHQFNSDESQSALARANVGLWDWDVHQDTFRLSREAGSLFGLERLRYPTTISEFAELLHLPVGSSAADDFMELLRNGNPKFEQDIELTQSDGSKRWIRILGGTNGTDDGPPQKLGGIILEVTEQKRAEEKLQERETKLRQYGNLTEDYMYDADLTKEPIVPREVVGDFERIVGLSTEDIAARGGWPNIIHADDSGAMEACFEHLHKGNPTVHEYRIVNADGEIRWLRDRAFPLLKNGKLMSVTGIVRDITSEKILKEQLIEAQKTEAIAQLAASVSHDINNLIFVISASLDLVPASLANHTELACLFDDVRSSCDRATELTRSLLAFSRRDKPEIKTVRLSKVVNDSLSIIQRSVGETVEVSLGVDASIEDRVEIDPGHLQLALLNLASNARAAMPNGGSLVVRTSGFSQGDADLPEMDSKGIVVLQVTDTGCGIDPKNLEQVFKPFFTTKPAGEGTGLGLALCSQIFEEAGGTIRIASRAGEGTTFSIYLPTVDSPVNSPSISASTFAVGGEERILLVEDDEAVRRVTERLLEKLGYQVVSADSVTAARAIGGKGIDLLIADVRLPDGDGPSLASQLRQEHSQLPVLLVSGYVDGKSRLKIDAEDYSVLPKPYGLSRLANSVRIAISEAKGD